MTQSCLVEQFQRYGSLSASDETLIRSLEKVEQVYSSGEIVQNQGSEVKNLYVVSKGWVISGYLLPDGSRQILNIFLPGDIVGLYDVPFKHAIASISTITPATLCPFPRQRVDELMRASKKLATTFFLLDMYQQSIMVERIVTLGQRTAFERLCHLLLEISYRMLERIPCGSDDGKTQSLRSQPALPLTQKQLADMLGLTEVHVNRTMGQLRADGLVEVHRGRIILLDTERLAKICRFKSAYLDLDLSWMSESFADGQPSTGAASEIRQPAR